MSNTMAVTDANFASEIEQASGLAVVDFWAEWCGPCRMVGPIVDQLAAEYAWTLAELRKRGISPR